MPVEESTRDSFEAMTMEFRLFGPYWFLKLRVGDSAFKAEALVSHKSAQTLPQRDL